MRERKTEPKCISINKVLLAKVENEAQARTVSLSQIIGEALCIRYHLDPKQAAGRKLKRSKQVPPLARTNDEEKIWQDGVNFLYFLWEKGEKFHTFSIKAIKYLDSQGIPTDALPKE